MRKGLLLAALLLPAALVLLYCVPPTGGSLYPRCLLHSLTGLHCPGCGATRALHSLLHGDLAQAAAFNVLFLASLPLLIGAGLRWAVLTWRGRPLPRWRPRGWVIFGIVVIITLFGIFRNLPFAPFNFLAPHQL
jgi:hypothetical protein